MKAETSLEILSVPSQGVGSGSHVLRNPMSPGLLTWLLLLIAHAAPGRSPTATYALIAVGAWFSFLYWIFRQVRIPLPWAPERDSRLIVAAGLMLLLLEATYFGGLPIFGSVQYNKFGFPVLHHVVFTIWVVPLLAPRRSFVYLLIALAVGAAMFNRQMMLLALAGFLLRSGLRQIWLPVLVVISLVALGSLRNQLIGIEEVVLPGSPNIGGWAGQLFFWSYLYVIGPYESTFGSGLAIDHLIPISEYWNTVPDWVLFEQMGLATGVSLGLFYTIVALATVVLTRIRIHEARLLGSLIHVMAFLTFFSSALISTPILGSFLVLSTVRRIQQMRLPSTHASGS